MDFIAQLDLDIPTSERFNDKYMPNWIELIISPLHLLCTQTKQNII